VVVAVAAAVVAAGAGADAASVEGGSVSIGVDIMIYRFSMWKAEKVAIIRLTQEMQQVVLVWW